MNNQESLAKKIKVIEFADSIGCNWRDEGDLLVVSFPADVVEIKNEH